MYQVPEEVLQAQRELGQAVQSLLRQAVQAEECYQEKEQPPTHQLCKPEQRCLLSDLCQAKKKQATPMQGVALLREWLVDQE